MGNLAAQIKSREVVQESAVVVRRDEDGWMVRSVDGVYRAKRAVSCLVEPNEDDVVLLATAQSGACYILAVLERDNDTKTRIVAEGDLEFSLRRGRFSVAASEGIGLVSKRDVSVVSAEVKVNAVDANVALQRATVVGRYLQSEFLRITSFATSFDGIFDRFSQRVKNAYRRVDGLDQLKAEHVDYSAKRVMSLHGENTVMTAKQLVKLDGDQIHVG